MNNIFLVLPPYWLFGCIAFFMSSVLFLVEVYEKDLVNKWLSHYILVMILSLYLGATSFSILSLVLDDIANKYGKNVWDIIISGKYGLVYYGGLVGVITSTHFFIKKGLIEARIYNILSFVIPFFHSISRVGCYYAGCCYGVHSKILIELPYFVNGFFSDSYRVPVQLFEAVFELLTAIVLFVLFKKMTSPKNLLNFYLGTYAVFRFMIEFIRGDTVRGIILGLSFSQYVSILIVISLIYQFVNKGRRNKCTP